MGPRILMHETRNLVHYKTGHLFIVGGLSATGND
jgi:hypothetical protein